MKKYNFFTGRFFTAFDLELEYKPDVVMITDPYIADHSILDIDTDCIQICGRFRNGVNSVTHIYRNNPDIVVKSREQIEWEISAHEFAYTTINTFYNNADSKESRFAFGSALETLPFRKFQYKDFTKNWFAIDNEINDVLVEGKYQSRISIIEWYYNCHFFNPTFDYCKYNVDDEKMKLVRAARSVKDKRRKIVQMLSEIEDPASEYALDFINEMRKIDSFIVDAYMVLGKKAIESLRYSQKNITEAIILSERKGNKVIRLIKNTVQVGNKYSNETIIDELTWIFGILNIRPENKITPKMILDYFQAVKCWVGKKKGYRLITELV